MLVNEAVDKLHPVLLVEGFLDPVLEGAKIVNRDFRYVTGFEYLPLYVEAIFTIAGILFQMV